MENRMNAVARKSILVVDDTSIVAETIDLLLSHLGHRVETSCDGPEALTKFESGKYHLVITDYRMPQMNGLELARAIKNREAGQLVVLLSAFTTPMFLDNPKPLPVDLIMEKPFSLDEFQKALTGLFPAG